MAKKQYFLGNVFESNRDSVFDSMFGTERDFDFAPDFDIAPGNFGSLETGSLLSTLDAASSNKAVTQEDGPLHAPTVLGVGDVAFLQYNSDTADIGDTFTFILLVDITGDTVINFTETGYNVGTGAFQTDEGGLAWTPNLPTGTTISAGTIVTITDTNSDNVLDSATNNTTGAAFGTVTNLGDGYSPNSTGDQAFIYQGALTTANLIYGLNFGGEDTTVLDADGWNVGATIDGNESNLPDELNAALNGGIDANFGGYTGLPADPAEVDNGYYSGQTTGTQEEILAAIADISNWTFANTSLPLQIYAVFDVSTPPPSVFELSSLLTANGGDGSTGFVINGIDAADESGFSVSSAGDINDDGFDDVIIGARFADPNGNSGAGESYVVFGSGAGFAASLDLSSLNGTNGFVINGIHASDFSGWSASGAGDINGDGFDDIIIGARSADPNGNGNAGESYIVFGSGAGFAASINLSSLNGTNGFVINGIDASDLNGYSVSGAGDINGDGFDDIIIGANNAGPNGNGGAGESYIIFGSGAGFAASLDLSTLNGTNGFVINGIIANDQSGVSVSSAGDINGDGFDDIIIGAFIADPNGNSGAGESYIVFGSGAGFAASFNLSSLNGMNGFVINGIDAGDSSGRSVSSAGDINGDGFDDIIIGAQFADPNGNSGAGESYIVFGSGAGFAASLDVSSLNGTNGFVINGIDASDQSGFSVSNAGDINGDGFDDIIIGAFGAFPNGNSSAGESYIVFGSGAGFAASLDVSSLNGTNGFVINGIDVGDFSGYSVSAAGDVNGDGFDDLIIGAYSADPNGNSGAGESYIIFGSADFGPAISATPVSASFEGAALSYQESTGAQNITATLTLSDADDTDLEGATISISGGFDGGNDSLVFVDQNGITGVFNAGTKILTLSGTSSVANYQAAIRSITYLNAFNTESTTQRTISIVVYDGDSNSVAVTRNIDFVTDETVTGSGGADNLRGGFGDDIINGGGGNDRLVGGVGDDTLNGGDGDDLLLGQDGVDTLNGDAGNDRLVAGDGDDILNGGAGNDRLWGGAGADAMDGGDGVDRAAYDTASAGVTANLATGGTVGDAAGDTYVNIEDLFGSNFNDNLTGDANANTILGLDGDDTMNGGAGNDRLVGGIGNDTMNGGADDDVLVGQGGNDTMNGDGGNDRLFGGDGADILIGDDGDDFLAGGAGDDALRGGNGSDKLVGGAGADVFEFYFDLAPSGQDTIFDFVIGVDKIEIFGPSAHGDLTLTASPNGQHTTITYNGHSIYVKNTTPAQLDAAQFTFIVPDAEHPDVDKTTVSEDIAIADKPIISDDDSFQFVEKSIVSDDLVSGSTNFGDFAVSQDVLAEFLSYAETHRDIFVGAEGAIGDGYDGNLSYFTEFFDFS